VRSLLGLTNPKFEAPRCNGQWQFTVKVLANQLARLPLPDELEVGGHVGAPGGDGHRILCLRAFICNRRSGSLVQIERGSHLVTVRIPLCTLNS
jgi:hypothetical protein